VHDLDRDFFFGGSRIFEPERSTQSQEEIKELIFMDMGSSVSQSVLFPVRNKHNVQSFSELVDWIIRIQVVFFELLEKHQNKQIQENILTNHDKCNPERNSSS